MGRRRYFRPAGRDDDDERFAASRQPATAAGKAAVNGFCRQETRAKPGRHGQLTVVVIGPIVENLIFHTIERAQHRANIGNPVVISIIIPAPPPEQVPT